MKRVGHRGLTLVELLVVLLIMSLAVSMVTLAFRDPAEQSLAREAVRLSTLLNDARARARSQALPTRWTHQPQPRFLGTPEGALPEGWLNAQVLAVVELGPLAAEQSLLLGPDAITAPQRVRLSLSGQSVVVQTDGVGPYALADVEPQP